MILNKIHLILCMFIIQYLSTCKGYKVLVLFPIPTRSHNNLGEGYVRNLLKAGHEVTFITPFPKNNPERNLRQISVADNVNALNVQNLNLQSLLKHEVELDQDLLFHMTMNITKSTLKNSEIQKLLKDPLEKFDVIIIEWMFTEIYCGFAAVFNCPYIWSFPYEPNFVGLSLIDEAPNPAYSVSFGSSDIPPFAFKQRVFELWYQIASKLKYMLFYEGIEDKFYRDSFEYVVAKRGRILPPYNELKYNASLMFGNSHVSIGQAISLPQNYIQIAGYHIDDVEPLPEDLKRTMDNAQNGIIYFSLGSNLKSKDLSDKMKNSILKIFSELKQTVIWKFEEELPNRPKNVHILKWAPQQSILAHPNCHLFITHGGLLSTTEALHFGVPFLGIPVFLDQNFNVDHAVKRGVAIKVVLTENGEDLKKAVQEILNNPIYRQKMKELSFIYHNRPTPPEKELVHWVHHVVRTGGAPQHRSSALLVPWYQKMFLDLIALITVVLFTVIYLMKLMCCRSHKIQNKKKRY